MAETIEIRNLDRMINEMLILGVLQEGPRHGYQIALEIEERSGGFFNLTHGTLYPILHHLEREDLIDGKWDEGQGRRKRKQYELTAAGRAYLRQRLAAWRTVDEHVSAFVMAGPAVRPGAAANQ